MNDLALAGILQISDENETVAFTNHFFLEYFLALRIADKFRLTSNTTAVHTEWLQRYTHSRDWETVIIAACGITEDSINCLEILLAQNPVLASKCLLSLNQTTVPASLRLRIVDAIEQFMLVPTDVAPGGEDRIVECAALLYLMSDAAEIPKMIDAMKLVLYGRFAKRIASLIERYGDLALPALHRYLTALEARSDSFNYVFENIVVTLAHIGNPNSIAPLTDVLEKLKQTADSETHEYETIVHACLALLGVEGHREIIIANILAEPSDWKRWYGLGGVSTEFIPDLVNILSLAAAYGHDFEEVGQAFVKNMKFQYGYRAYPYLANALSSAESPPVKSVLLDAIGQIGEISGALPLLQLMQDSDPYVKHFAVVNAGRLRARETIWYLIALLNDADPLIRHDAAVALGNIGDPSAVKALRTHLRDCSDVKDSPNFQIFISQRVCDAAASALVHIGTPEAHHIVMAWCKEIIATKPASEAYDRIGGLLINIDTFEANELWNSLYNQSHGIS